MNQQNDRPLLDEASPVARRQPKTDRLFLGRLVDAAGRDKRLDEQAMLQAHQIVSKWAELEDSGRLSGLRETQLQGDFLAEIFGQVLGYQRAVDNDEQWHLEQHHTIAGQTPDAILGHFREDEETKPLAVIELKGPTVHVDRDRSNGRTAVDQCWDYLVNTPPECRWGIVSNIVSFRLYERDSTKRVYEHFSLQSLKRFDNFRRFYALFRRKGLIETTAPSAGQLLRETRDRQRTVSDELYDAYSEQRTRLIAYLHHERSYPVDEAIEMAQRLFDRIMFIAFCEDRQLLPEKTICRAQETPGFSAVTNPRWQNFKNLFRFIDAGNPAHNIPPYNGGLFATHPVDELELPDQPWTNFFQSIGTYDFADEVNLDVLGHLFERSITELEKLKKSGLFAGDAEKAARYASMPQSAKRKQFGIYYTPPELTSRIVQYTVDELIVHRLARLAKQFDIAEADARRGVYPSDAQFWRQALELVRDVKIVDPACGSGAFLFQAYNSLELWYHEIIGHLALPTGEARELAEQVPYFILQENLFGVDLLPEAVEITQLALWIRSATPGQTLATLSDNIVLGNSLVHDAKTDPVGFDWRTRFPEVFDREGYESTGGGFDCVIGNPPWERIKLQQREFFSLPAPQIATATNAARRRQLVALLESDDPALYERYEESLAAAQALLDYCRSSGEYPLTGCGDINTYAVFAELAAQLVAPAGRVGLLTPSGIATDKTTKDFFASVAESNRLVRLHDFENRLKQLFPDVDGRFKFCILNFGGAAMDNAEADYVFFAHRVEELDEPQRRIRLSGDDIRLLNPNTRTCPIFRTRRDAEITKAIYRHVPVLIDRNRHGPTGNPWGVRFKTMFHQTNDAELFREAETLAAERFKLKGNRWVKRNQTYLPLYEAKMLQAYDHRAANVVTDQANWVRQGQTKATTLVEHQNPEYLALPRFWVNTAEVEGLDWGAIGFKDITSPTNQRTMIAAVGPLAGYTNHFVLTVLQDDTIAPRRQLCLLANMNAFVFDFCTRQKIGGVTLNFFIVEQLPAFSPDTYANRCPWDRRATLETWISERVLRLSCTAEDMLPLAEACDFNSGSFRNEYDGRLNKWDEAERAQLMAELDAAFLHLYGVNRDDAEYILSTFTGIHDAVAWLPNRRSVAEQTLAEYDALA